MEEASQPLSVSLLSGGTQRYVSGKVIWVYVIRIYFLPVVSSIYLTFAAFMNTSASKLTWSNTCRSKYKTSLNLAALTSALKILDAIVKIYHL